MLDEKLLVFVLGAPGAGKGTQCDLIVKHYGWAHFSAGDLLRAQVKAGTEMGKQAEEYLKAGTMVPASMIIGLLKEALSDAQHTKVLIDGFPRVLDQLKDFEQTVRPCDSALFFNVPEEAAKERLLKRGQTSGRVDDNEETIHNRFIVFKEESMPVITELEKEGRAVEINAAQTPEQVFETTRKVIEQLEQKQASRAKQPELATATTDTAAVSALAAAAAVSSPVTSAVQSPRASVTPTAASPVAAAAAVGSSPTSPQAAATTADTAAEPAALASLAAAAQSPGAPASPVAAGSPAGSAVSSPVKAAVGSPVAAAAAPAAVAASPTAAGAVPAAAALTAAAAGAAATAAAASPAKSDTAQADAPAAAESPAKAAAAPPAVVVPAEVAGVPAQLDVTSPTAAGAVSPSPRATLASLHVDLSGIRTPIVICGPSGVGKGTLISKLMEQHPDRFGFSVSHTTRGPRPGEVHGKHYYFTEKEAMSAQVAAGMFLEHADVHGNMYGTSLAAVAQVSAAGKHCVLDIDVQGAAQVRKSALGPHCLFIFVAPPSHDELERRLRNRGTETEDKVLQRLANAESEIAKAQEPGLFHHVLVNADLETAYQELQKLIAPRVPGLLPDTQQAAAAAGAGSQRTSEAGSAVVSTPKAAAAGNATATTPPAVSPVATNAAGMAGIAAAAAAAAAATAALSPRQQQQQAAQQAQPHPIMANGTASSAVAVAGGTSTLLDFGFGASAGPAVAAKGMPVRQYMDATVIPVLREGLKALNAARPDDPLQFLADYLVAHKAAAA